ncbi:hypothetical protein [Streptomyces curacoi]|uniref:Calcium-binding protein n=1 Tax=Streptomyces curacoi TaxID=146536 RepID=A0A117P3F6_9ACTN|nr:hypothetical protein [Streptomyces curacoi]KUM72366.1 hypothetical protein AQI70_24020 [Streptomyces curacoi]
MRIRATVAAVTGALALSALVVPAAQAADTPASGKDGVREAVQTARQAAGESARSTYAAEDTGTPYALDVTFSNVKVNNGKPIVVGTTNKVTAPVTYTVTHSEDVDLRAEDTWVDVELYRGEYGNPTNFLIGDDWPVCTAVSATVDTCKGTIDIYPAEELTNADATTWKAAGYVIDWNDQDPYGEEVDFSKVGYAEQDALTTTKLQRFSKLTVNASPEPVKKGKTITVTGKLSRANWDRGTYNGYANQSVKLQFRKNGSSTYTTLKTIKTNTYGELRTTVTAATDGYFRYRFEGTSTTPAVSATGDFVDVQ